tara:strand:+ start:1224 stop:1487 length:264 start_codon:yes stop_codon:yes gene_type:complete
MNRPLMKTNEVCWELNISRPTLIKRIKDGIIECTKYGRDYRFNPDHIQDLKEGKKWGYTKPKGRPIGKEESKYEDSYLEQVSAQLKK